MSEENSQQDINGSESLITDTGGSFRDSVSNINKKGQRVWIYPTKPKGSLNNWRMLVGYTLLALMVAIPFIKVDGKPLLLFDIFNRQFIIFSFPFWPQDFFIFALAFLALIIFIVLFTAVYGRLWCGWLCPQTVFMELVFRKIEFWIEGDGPKQKKLNEGPLSANKLLRKTAKHIVFISISLATNLIVAAYIVGIDVIYNEIIKAPFVNFSGTSAILLISGAFYFVFFRFREQACIYVCPYARLQSVLIDKNSIIVAYDNKRGEPRGKLSKKEPSTNGDCIDCGMCVKVCPTGIDIRNGIQLECVNCANCIDACDTVMTKINKPKKLIKYASLNMIENNLKFRFSPRIILYSAALFVLLFLVSFILSTRSDVEATILRAKGTVFVDTHDGYIADLYTAKIANKTFKPLTLTLKVENRNARVRIIGENELKIQPDRLIETAFFVDLPKKELLAENTPIKIGVYANGKLLQTVKTSFSGPDRFKEHDEHKDRDEHHEHD